MSKKRYKNQSTAQKRNFSIFRLRGMVASLDNIIYEGELTPGANSCLVGALGHIKDALIAETEK